ncbi:hypothetical protein B0A48_11169 [Cryoendolithus antarcticus]|uniref:Heterokaryon incompatibility domain-containing protein n=1 Tax=Cryoendolithus antarcticus TaxID=1507870 RepID=A0A1V8SUQ6_9PEZI|nr:hypothetical protein B0A48_11169 [Cryoendolithus antarcticus]
MDHKEQLAGIAEMYAQLPLSACDNIRLLRLQGGQFYTPLVGTLIVGDMTEKSGKHTYDALSYAWGAATLRRRLLLIGPKQSQKYALPITDNLYTALRRLRHSWMPRVIWVDAICINQDDVKERSQQVGSMRFIYGWAKNVYVWLGDAELPGRADRYALRFDRALKPDAVIESLRAPRSSPSRTFSAFVSMLNTALPQTSPSWHTRAWVYQEYHLARNIVWCIGPYQQKYTKLEFAKLSHLAYQYRPTEDLKSFKDAVLQLSAPFTQRGISTFAWSFEVDPRKSKGAQMSVHTHAAITQNMRCRYAMDKVYSLLGVMDFQSSAQMRPDYSKSSSWVFAEATWLSLEMSHDFAVLLNARGVASPVAPADLPSWAFDSVNGLFYHFPSSCGSLFEIWLGSDLPDPSPRLSDDHKELRLNGSAMDSITHASQETIDADTPNISTYERFVAMAGALAEQEAWRGQKRPKIRAWPPIDVQTRIASGSAFPIDVEAWNDIFPLSRVSKEHADHLGEPVAWASCVTMFVTAGGHLGLTTAACAREDVVFVVKGCPYPLIICKLGERYAFRGCAYIPAYSYQDFSTTIMESPCNIALV